MPLTPAEQARMDRDVKYWKEGPFDQKTKDAVNAMTKDQLHEAFGSELVFGTGGIRSVMDLGVTRMNIYTIRRITLGIAAWVRTKVQMGGSVVIGHDSRHNSELFMQEVSRVLACKGITAIFFPYPAATPAVSFAVRHLKADAGIMITASHNPKEYNGYKVYSSAGYQVLDEDAEMIAKFISESLDYASIQLPPFKNPLIVPVSDECDQSYIKGANLAWHQKIASYSASSQPSVLFTPLHGVGGYYFIRQAAAASYNHVEPVPAQNKPDGEFPTVIFANPEDPKAFDCALEMIRSGKSQVKVIIANDPDADRMGAAFIEKNGEVFIPNGNEIATMLLAHTIRSIREFKIPLKNPTVVKSVVTTPALDAICAAEKIDLIPVLPGFKYIGQKMDQWSREIDTSKQRELLLGAEESYGYLVGQHSRDKDGIIAGVLMIDLVSRITADGLSARQYLHQIYLKHGLHRSKTFSINLPKDLTARAAVIERLNKFFENPPKEILDEKVTSYEDYRRQLRYIEKEGKMESQNNHQPKADILQYASASFMVTLRPSGTEPKLKLYISQSAKVPKIDVIPQMIAEMDQKIEKASKEIQSILQV